MDVDYDRLAFVSLRVQRTDFRKAGQAVGRCSLDRKCRLGCSPFFQPGPRRAEVVAKAGKNSCQRVFFCQ